MKKTAVRVLSSILFCFLAVMMFAGINRVLTIKGKEYAVYSTYAQYNGFYEMKKDTVDVLFLGTSHAYCGFSPQEFYDRYGIRSYNLGSSKQSIWISYYWLKEALKTQSPQIVIQEVYYADLDNGDEASAQKALSYMRWSDNKAEAVRTAVGQFPELNFKSFLFPNLRFHNRWEELAEEDFIQTGLLEGAAFKGNAPASTRVGETQFRGLRAVPGTSEEIEWSDLAREYWDKITDLCRENGITLVLVKTPCAYWSEEEHNAVQTYAQQNGLTFYDLNSEENYKALHYDFAVDNNDEGHANLWGAEKIASFIGKKLIREHNARSVEDEQWEKTSPYVAGVKKELGLKYIDDAQVYLEELLEGDYSILISVKGDVSDLGENLKRKMAQLGFSEEPDDCYAAAIDRESGAKREDSGGEEAVVQGTLRGGMTGYEVLSRTSGESCSSIIIDGTEYSPDRKGINIVVYGRESNTVVDAVCLASDKGYEPER